MNDAYDVSVVIPVHNTNPRMFDHVVESMFSQTLGFDRVEWIVVLHNCREDCAAYVHEKLDGHPNVLIVPLDNEAHSPSSPRNHGLRMARGEFIGFLDADDGYTPACLEKALRYIRETDADVCHFRRKVELEKEGVIESVPGRGFYVCEQKNDLLREKQMMNLENRMSELLADCENAGMTLKDIIDMVRVLGEK